MMQIIKRFFSWSETSLKKSQINGVNFYQKNDEDYNGLFRLLTDFKKHDPDNKKPIKKYLIVQGDICSIADETKLFEKYAIPRSPIKNIIIDMSTEAINLKLANQFFVTNIEKLITIINAPKYKKFKFYLVHANTASQDIFNKIINNLSASNPKLFFIGIDFYLGRFIADLKKNAQLIQELASNQKPILNNNHNKYFLCLNHRPRWHRYAIVSSLIINNHLEKGLVSFAGEEKGRIDAPTIEMLSDVKNVIMRLTEGQKLLQGLTALEEVAPIILDIPPEKIQEELWGKETTGHIGQPLGIKRDTQEFNSALLSYYFEIVTETYFTDESCSYITEKTFRPIIFQRPFIHVGTPNLLKKLRSYGFKTFSPYFDESYDEIIDPVARMNCILKEINRLCNMSEQEIYEIYSQLLPTVKYNYEHYINNGEEIFLKNDLASLSKKLSSRKNGLLSVLIAKIL